MAPNTKSGVDTQLSSSYRERYRSRQACRTLLKLTAPETATRCREWQISSLALPHHIHPILVPGSICGTITPNCLPQPTRSSPLRPTRTPGYRTTAGTGTGMAFHIPALGAHSLVILDTRCGFIADCGFLPV